MKINGEMLILARDYRNFRQQEVADAIGISQSLIAKIEVGLKSEIEDESFEKLTKFLNFSAEFFQQHEHLLGFGSSSYFFRKRAAIPAAERRKIHAIVNLHRISLRQYIKLVDIESTKPLPMFEIEEYGHCASNIAQALRATWNMPDGPVRDLTALVESAGVIVIPCDFESNKFDATSLRLADMPPLIFMNSNLPGDRWRFTLAHELGHLVMHSVPHERMEDEANEFAAEFLTPAAEIKPQLMRVKSWRLPDVVRLKIFWRVAIGMLLVRAKDLKVFSPEESKRLFMRHAQIRLEEPEPLDQEKVSSLNRVITAIRDDLGFEVSGLANLNKWPDDITQKLLAFSSPSTSRLRLVR